MRVRNPSLVFVALGILSVGVSGCTGQAPPEETAETPAVTVVTPKRQTLKRTIMQPGWVRAYEQTPIYSRIPGYVEAVLVDIGDHVHEDQVLARLWVPELEKDWQAKSARADQAEAQVMQARQSHEAAKAVVRTAKAQVEVAQAGIDKAEADYQRWAAELVRAQKMYKDIVYDKQNLDVVMYSKEASNAARAQAKASHGAAQAAQSESEARENKAKADVDAALESWKVAKADRDQAKVWYDYREIKAPYAAPHVGVVTQRNIHTKHFVQPSNSGTTSKTAEPLFHVVRIDKVRVNVQVPEYDAPWVKDGLPAVVTFQALKGTPYHEVSGTVTRSTDVLDEQARTLRVEIHLPNPHELFLPGMYVSATIKVEIPNTLTLPASAVFTDGEKSYCFIVDGGKAVQTAIKIGVSNDDLVQILKKQSRSGQSGGHDQWEDFTGREPIVSTNPESLIDGQTITVAAQQ